MAFSGVRPFWSSVTGSGCTRRPAAAPHGEHNFLPQDSVIISERTRRANKLGEGSFAKVFRGEFNGKPCAVKVFKEDMLRKELTPLWSEVEVLSKVQHTNVVKMYGMWFDPHKDRAVPSIVMELCDESLYDFIKRFKGKLAISAHMYSLRRQSFHWEEGGAQPPPERINLDALMDICRYYKDERDKEIERAAEKQCILASKKETDEKVECIEVRDGEIKHIKAQFVPHKMEAASVPLPSAVVDVTADEGLLQQLCYMATGVKQLRVSADGGRFTLGSGDASLEFPPGTVEKETSVRYAIILHGPFVLPAGYKPGSVVIYLNMDGATLLKPVLLYLSHWCIKEEGEDEDTLKFVSASHTLEAGQQAYVFEEEDDADLTRTNVGVLSICDPHCLFCVVTKGAKVAMYNAIAFSRYIPSEETLLFRIQLMCDSLEWIEKLTTTLQLKNWEKTSDVVTQFQYADGQHQITASPTQMSGPGWEAAICGQHGVMEQTFLEPLGKSKDEVEQGVISGRFPPCILYKIIYSSPEEKRTRPALLKVDLNGANISLSFSCRVMEEMYSATSVHHSPSHTPQRTAGAETPPSSPQAEIQPADVIQALNQSLDARWRHFGTHLRVESAILDGIETNRSNEIDCMLQLVEKWLAHENGTGDLPRTWETVVQAVKDAGNRLLAEQLARRYGVQLSGH